MSDMEGEYLIKAQKLEFAVSRERSFVLGHGKFTAGRQKANFLLLVRLANCTY